MLSQMCRSILSDVDVKAICKNRGLPPQAAASRSLLESLFLSDTGVAEAFRALERREVVVLHLLTAIGEPVDVAFFHRLNPALNPRGLYGTYTQRYQRVFAAVKERFVRRGLLLLALARESWPKKTQLERWQMALPAPFAALLPPLVTAPRQLDGAGDWRSDVARTKLTTAVSPASDAGAKDDPLEIADGELRLGGQPFRSARLSEWQQTQWQKEAVAKKRPPGDRTPALLPTEAMRYVLGTLAPGSWSAADSLGEILEIFCGAKVDSSAVCESGWRWGCLARQEADGKAWYRLAPRPSADDIPPDRYLDVRSEGPVAVDLDTVPFETLEQLVLISDQRPPTGARPVLLVTPNQVKLGRATDEVLAGPLVDWLQHHAPAFTQALETLRQRRGKTIVHENLAVARVGDLGLKVAIEKALGGRCVALGEDYLAFPPSVIEEVERLVTKSGHVIQEAKTHGR